MSEDLPPKDLPEPPGCVDGDDATLGLSCSRLSLAEEPAETSGQRLVRNYSVECYSPKSPPPPEAPACGEHVISGHVAPDYVSAMLWTAPFVSPEAVGSIERYPLLFEDLINAICGNPFVERTVVMGPKRESAWYVGGCYKSIQRTLRNSRDSGRRVLHWAVDEQSNQFSGYIPALAFVVPLVAPAGMLDREVVFVCQSSESGEVSMVVAPDDSYEQDVYECIAILGHVKGIDIFCSWCGLAAKNLRSCQCKLSRYCGRDCQLAHWELHKPHCPKSKSKSKSKPKSMTKSKPESKPE